MKIFKETASKLSSQILEIAEDRRIKTEKQKKVRILETWKQTTSRAIEDCSNDFEKNIMRTYQNAFTCRHTEMNFGDVLKFVSVLCEKMFEENWEDWKNGNK